MVSPQDFVHLHVHTEYSLLDGASRIPDLVARARDIGMAALAITDHGTMSGVIPFYKECLAQGIKPIIGSEVYVARRTRHDKEGRIDQESYHLTLLAADQQGYRNLMRLSSAAHLEGFYYKPRVDRELLRQYHAGIIALGGCAQGQVSVDLLNGDEAAAEQHAAEFAEIFGPDNFYLEVMQHGLDFQEGLNRKLIALSERMGIPLVATNDSHYTRREDADAHDILLCIQTGKTVDDPDRLRFGSDQFFLKTPEEMAALFPDRPDVIANTHKVAKRCNLELELGQFIMPVYEPPEDSDLHSYLRSLCEQNLPLRYPDAGPEVHERLDYELDIIEKTGYSGYFLIVADFVRYAREQCKMLVGPGRGSATGSVVAYLLGITEIDPIEHGLVFERMLNPERKSPPDIDCDFPDDRRDEVLQYVRHKYGSDKVAQIITFGTMAARAAVRDSGRALKVPLATVDAVAKLIPFSATIAEALETVPELKQLYAQDETVKRLLDTARGIEGLARHASTHASAVVIGREELTNYVPLQRGTGAHSDAVTTQYAMDECVDAGLVKMDFLGLRTLTVIEKAIAAVRRTRGEDIDIYNIPMDDPKTYEMLSRGDTTGVFQLESEGMRKILRDLQPSEFGHILPLIALYRPGPMAEADNFIRGRHGAKVEYLHPKLEPLLRETFGVILYQEQCMKAAQELAGFTMGQAEILVRAMSKKQIELMEQMRAAFLEGCQKNGIEPDTARQIFERIKAFAGYGFNKSHSAAYALVAYWTAYLKANYPTEYLAACMTSVMASSEKVAEFAEDARQLGIRVVLPDVNRSEAEFVAGDSEILFGLAAIRNLGRGVANAIQRERETNGPFRDLRDFCERLAGTEVNKATVETLIRCGAMDAFGHRAQLLAALDSVFTAAQRARQDRDAGQVSLFDAFAYEDQKQAALPDVAEFDKPKLLAMEKELLGLFVSDHPLLQQQQRLQNVTTARIRELQGFAQGTPVVVGGVVTRLSPYTTKSGDRMMFFTLEDQDGSIEVTVFPKAFEKSKQHIIKDAIVVVDGHVDIQHRTLAGEETVTVKLLADRVVPVEAARKPSRKKTDAAQTARAKGDAAAQQEDRQPNGNLSPAPAELHIVLGASQANSAVLGKLRDLLRGHAGPHPVRLHIKGQNGGRHIRLGPTFVVEDTVQLRAGIAELLGEDAIWISSPSA